MKKITYNDEMKKIITLGEEINRKKRRFFNELGDLSLLLIVFAPLIIFISLLFIDKHSILIKIILSLSVIPLLILTASIAYLIANNIKPASTEEVLKKGVEKYGGIGNMKPYSVALFCSQYLNNELENYVVKNNLSKIEKELFYQLVNENYQGTISDLTKMVKII
jgi:hypothetical protein